MVEDLGYHVLIVDHDESVADPENEPENAPLSRETGTGLNSLTL
jgi:hypothetical protein